MRPAEEGDSFLHSSTDGDIDTGKQTGKESEGPEMLEQPVLWTRKADTQRLRVLRKAKCTQDSTTLLFNSFPSWC